VPNQKKDTIFTKKRLMRIFVSLCAVLIFGSCQSDQAENGVSEQEVNHADTVYVSDSLSLLNQIIVDNPTNPSAYLQRAKFHMRNYNAESAMIDVKKVLDLDSSYLEARLIYADIQVAELELEKAQYQYKYVLQKDSLAFDAYLGLARIFSVLDNAAQSVFYIDKALGIDPNLAEAYFLKGMIYRADVQKTKRQESWDRAISSFQTAIEQDPDFYEAYIELGVMYEQVDSDLALQYYNSALDIYPESTEAWYNKGMYFQNKEDFPNAFRAYKQLIKIDSSWSFPYYNQGYIFLTKLEVLDSAIYYFEKAVERDNEFAQAHNNLGLSYELNGQINLAKKHYEMAYRIDPEFTLALENLESLK
jgi:tetratricopeptide (TPR) repeat protein